MSVTSKIEQNEDFSIDLTRKSISPHRVQRKLRLIHVVVLASLGAAVCFASLQFKAATTLQPNAGNAYQLKTDDLMSTAEAYLDGKGVAKNVATAITLLTQAADNGSANAAFMLGGLYEKGIGDNAISQAILGETTEHDPKTELMQDYSKAAAWYLQAAKQGNAAAQSALGRLYWGGNGVKADAKIAYKLQALAASMGYKEAATLQSQAVGQISNDELPAVQQAIDGWSPVAGSSGQIVERIINP